MRNAPLFPLFYNNTLTRPNHAALLQLLLAQLLRHKLNTQGWALPPASHAQLRDLLLARTAAHAQILPSPLLNELLLALCAVFCLWPDAGDPVAAAAGALPAPAAARFLQLIAEDTAGDLRRINHGGLSECAAVCSACAQLAVSCEQLFMDTYKCSVQYFMLLF